MTAVTNEWADALANRVLAGKYRLVRVLGRGGMGAVFEAEQPALGRRVAIKLVLPHRQSDERAMQRFALEAKAAARVADGGVPQVLDFDYDAELGPFQVLELLEGESLQARIARGPLSSPSAYAVVLETLAVLARVHAAGVVHRDIKPANVFLETRPDGLRRVRVLDFGVARVRDPRQPRMTQTGAMLGTLGYMAPEALTGADVDHRADLYSAAVLLWSCLTGQEPFAGQPAGAIIAAVHAGQVPSLRRARPELSERLQRAYEWATALDPNARPASAAALATELHRAQLDEGAAASVATSRPPGSSAPGVQHAPTPAPGARDASTMLSGASASGASASGTPAWATPPLPSAPGGYPGSPSSPGSGASMQPAGAPSQGAYSVRTPAPAPPRATDTATRRRSWVMPAALALALGALGATATMLVWVMSSGSNGPSGTGQPQQQPPLNNLFAVPPPPQGSAPDPTLETARADLASARSLAAQQRDAEAIALVQRARMALMSPPPPEGSPRVAALAEAQIALGDLYRSRIPGQSARVQGNNALQSVMCYDAVHDSSDAAISAYNTLLSDARFLEQRQCGEQRLGLLYEALNSACGRTRESSASYVRMMVMYYRMADRPGPCQQEASAGLARSLAVEAGIQ